jgi:tRNA G18 (ribose-2'-O)-methylase SpoU
LPPPHHPLLTHLAPGGRRRCQPLTIVASLVTKAVNLGGLARTAEVFGCESLVVPDLAAAAADPAFAAVSVSSAEWMTMASVPPPALLAYLHERRAAGDRIVALEQAARSTALGRLDWLAAGGGGGGGGGAAAAEEERHTLLVLGAELQGMPTDVLAACDDVVEIPQLGIVRSLNVHVAAALCVWEYTRQRADAAAAAAAGAAAAR